MLIRYIISCARAHLKSAVLIFILFVLFTHHTTSIDTVTTHQSRDTPLTTDTPTNSSPGTNNGSMSTNDNQSNTSITAPSVNNINDNINNDYPMDSIIRDDVDIADTREDQGQNMDSVGSEEHPHDHNCVNEGEEIEEEMQNTEEHEDGGDGDHGDDGGTEGDHGDHGDHKHSGDSLYSDNGRDTTDSGTNGDEGDTKGDDGDTNSDDGDTNSDDGDTNGNSEVDDHDRRTIRDDGCTIGDDDRTMGDDGCTMEDNRHTNEDNGCTNEDNGPTNGDDGRTNEDNGATNGDDGRTNGDDGCIIGDNELTMEDDGHTTQQGPGEHLQESTILNKTTVNDSVHLELSEVDQIISNTTDESLSEGDAPIAMTTGNEEAGQELDELPDTNDDDIVTFEEFKNKMNQEGVNSKPAQRGASVPARQSYHSYHNYALTECGASVLESNKQAKNAGSILLENKDLYMLNPCSADIWFVIELCELVSVSILEISCFELFSSIPETIAVYTSDSYPNPVWEKLGIFTLNDERGTQKFPLEESVYTKYIKFEMLTHYGTEHYCPVSTIKVLGSTMIEEYEYTESQRDGVTSVGGGTKGEQQYTMEEIKSDKIISNDNGKAPPQEQPDSQNKGNPIKVATDAILKFVGKAVNGFIVPLDEEYDELLEDGSHEQQQHLINTPATVVTFSSTNPSTNVYDESNSQDYSKSDRQLTSEEPQESALVNTQEEVIDLALSDNHEHIEPDVSKTFKEADDFTTAVMATTASIDKPSVTVIDPLGPTNGIVLSTSDNKNQQSSSETTIKNSTTNKESEPTLLQTMQTTTVEETPITSGSIVTQVDNKGNSNPSMQPILKPRIEDCHAEATESQYCNNESNDAKGMSSIIVEDHEAIIAPTPTTAITNTSATTSNSTSTDINTVLINNTTPLQQEQSTTATDDDVSSNSITTTANKLNTTGTNKDVIADSTTITDSSTTDHALDDSNNANNNHNNNNDNGNIESPTSSYVPGTTREKSVFVRLSNRINILELNMTLFDTYLDQISQSLKKNKNRTEDMQKSLERRIGALNDTIQFIREKVTINASLFDTVLSSVTELNKLYLSQQEDWTNFVNYVSSHFLIIIFLQALTIVACCILHRSRSNRFRQLEKSVQQMETYLRDINMLLSSKTPPISHHHSNGNINKANGSIVLNSSHKNDKNSQAVTITGGQHRRHHSFSSDALHSASSPNLLLITNDDQKWKKVEHKKHKKSGSKKSEQ